MTDSNALKAGDVVQLKSGEGPLMVVQRTNDDLDAFCVWFGDSEKKSDWFEAVLLKEVDNSKGPVLRTPRAKKQSITDNFR